MLLKTTTKIHTLPTFFIIIYIIYITFPIIYLHTTLSLQLHYQCHATLNSTYGHCHKYCTIKFHYYHHQPQFYHPLIQTGMFLVNMVPQGSSFQNQKGWEWIIWKRTFWIWQKLKFWHLCHIKLQSIHLTHLSVTKNQME